MIGLDELAGWTPVALRLTPEPGIDWVDLSGERFAEPFFDQTVARLIGGPHPRALVRTGLDALLELDHAPSLEPSGIILHLSRCGSTVASRLLATMPGTLVLAEPAPVNDLLRLDPGLVNQAVQANVLRLLVRALGRIRLGDERRMVLKLSSWNVRRLEIIRAAFPDVPMIWVQRRPIEIMQSLLRGRPGWLRLDHDPRLAEHLFGIPAAELASLDPAELCARVLRAMLESAAAAEPGVVDYRDLPDAVWRIIAPSFGIRPNDAEVARMRDEARYSAKETGRVAFVPDAGGGEAPGAVRTDAIRALAASWLDPAYALLDARRFGGGRPCSS